MPETARHDRDREPAAAAAEHGLRLLENAPVDIDLIACAAES